MAFKAGDRVMVYGLDGALSYWNGTIASVIKKCDCPICPMFGLTFWLLDTSPEPKSFDGRILRKIDDGRDTGKWDYCVWSPIPRKTAVKALQGPERVGAASGVAAGFTCPQRALEPP